MARNKKEKSLRNPLSLIQRTARHKHPEQSLPQKGKACRQACYILSINHPGEKSESLHFAINCKTDPRPGRRKVISLDLHTYRRSVRPCRQSPRTARRQERFPELPHLCSSSRGLDSCRGSGGHRVRNRLRGVGLGRLKAPDFGFRKRGDQNISRKWLRRKLLLWKLLPRESSVHLSEGNARVFLQGELPRSGKCMAPHRRYDFTRTCRSGKLPKLLDRAASTSNETRRTATLQAPIKRDTHDERRAGQFHPKKLGLLGGLVVRGICGRMDRVRFWSGRTL